MWEYPLSQKLESWSIQFMENNSFSIVFLSRIDGVMRTMNAEKLLKTLPIIQNQLDALLDFDVSIGIDCDWL